MEANIIQRSKGCRSEDYFNDYVVFDLETTGLNIHTAEIIEISAVRVVNGEIVNTFSELVKPSSEIPYLVTSINGITNEMVENSPTIEYVLPLFFDFIGSSILIGHNIHSFDTNLLYDYAFKCCNMTLQNDYVDTLYLARRKLPQPTVPNHKLVTICEYFNVDVAGNHRALKDCYMAKECYERMILLEDSTQPTACISVNKVSHRKNGFTDETKALQELNGFLSGITSDNALNEQEVSALQSWLERHNDLAGNYPFDCICNIINMAIADAVLSDYELSEMLDIFKQILNPVENNASKGEIEFLGKTFCLSGEFSIGSKNEVEMLIQAKGAECGSNVTSKTNYLIVGGQGNPNWKCGTYGSKIKKALEMQEKGLAIEIISENDFQSIIGIV